MTEIILHGHSRLMDYARKLTVDIKPEQMADQPQPGMNHPAWIFAHLNVYVPVINSIILGEEFPDPKDHKFGIGSILSPNLSDYPDQEELYETFFKGNEKAATSLSEKGPSVFKTATTLPRWQANMPTAGHVLGYLMLGHQGVHLGQLSAWRRVQGLPPA